MLNLFYSPAAVSRASLIVLEEIEAQYTLTRVDFASGEQHTAAYKQINPLGRVPALQTDSGLLTETTAILSYLALAYPDKNMAMSNDNWAFAQIQSFNSLLASSVHVNHAHGRRGERWATEQSSFDDMLAMLPKTMTASMQLVEERIVGPWVMGDHYTISDPYLFTIAGWLEGDGVDITQFPKLAQHFENMSKRDAVINALRAEV